jgi:hypothetical protein
MAEGDGLSDCACSVASRVGGQILEKNSSAKEITSRVQPSNSHFAATDSHHSSS